MDPTIFELWVMETENWIMKIAKPNAPLKTHYTQIASHHQPFSPTLGYHMKLRNGGILVKKN